MKKAFFILIITFLIFLNYVSAGLDDCNERLCVCSIFSVRCSTNINGINSLMAYIKNTGIECAFVDGSWNGGNATFNCNASGRVVYGQEYDVICAVDSAKSYQTGNNYSAKVSIFDCSTINDTTSGTCNVTTISGNYYNEPQQRYLCADGISTAISAEPTNFSWSCLSFGGGNNASCFAKRKIDGKCNQTTINQTYYTYPLSYLCSNGTSTDVITNNNNFSWVCGGINNAINQVCYVKRYENCSDGFDNDDDNEWDYDTLDRGPPGNIPPKGDYDCRIGITGVWVSNATPGENSTIQVRCGSTVPYVNSIEAYIIEDTIVRKCRDVIPWWDEDKALFECDVGSVGEKSVICTINNTKSYQDGQDQYGQDQNITIQVQIAPITSIHCGNGLLDIGEECDNGTFNTNSCFSLPDLGCSYCDLSCNIRANITFVAQTCSVPEDCIGQSECCYGFSFNHNGTCINQLPNGTTDYEIESDSCLCKLSRSPAKQKNGTCLHTGDYPCWDTNPSSQQRCCGNIANETWDIVFSTSNSLEDVLITGYCYNGTWLSREDYSLTHYSLWVG